MPATLPLPAPPGLAGVLPSAQTTRAYFAWLLSVLPRTLAVQAIAWAICFGILAAMLRRLKPRLKPGLMKLDDDLRAWAKTLRYQAQHPDASPEDARRAAQIELAAQKHAEYLDRDLDVPHSSTSTPSSTSQAASGTSSSTSGGGASTSTLSATEKAASNGHLWIDGNRDGFDDRDRNHDGQLSEDEKIAAALDEESPAEPERVPLTWFFRFWTNFASAPSLSVLSLAVPLFAAHRAGGVSTSAMWLSRSFPGSFWARALAQNIAPPQLAFVAAAGLSAPALQAARIWTAPGVCYTGAMFLSFWLKRVFKRLRPQRKPGGFGHKLKDGSFPSGHSLTSFCFWLAVATSSLRAGATPLQGTLIGLASASIVAFTGLSRVYLGVHFPSDVLGGFGVGTAWCILCLPALAWALHL